MTRCTVRASQIQVYDRRVKCGHTSTKDEPRSRRLVDIVLSDRRLKVREWVEATRVSKGTVIAILQEKLGLQKISARWVPHLLSPENKRTQVVTSEALLARIRGNPQDFWRQLITVDETWIHYYTPETKEQSKQWISKGEPAPKKAKTVKSADKVMATVFWDAYEIIHIDYLQKGQSLDSIMRHYWVSWKKK